MAAQRVRASWDKVDSEIMEGTTAFIWYKWDLLGYDYTPNWRVRYQIIEQGNTTKTKILKTELTFNQKMKKWLEWWSIFEEHWKPNGLLDRSFEDLEVSEWEIHVRRDRWTDGQIRQGNKVKTRQVPLTPPQPSQEQHTTPRIPYGCIFKTIAKPKTTPRPALPTPKLPAEQGPRLWTWSAREKFWGPHNLPRG